MKSIEGIIAAMVTPMTADEAIDEKNLRRLVNRLVGAGVQGLFCLGTTGEFYALTPEEKQRVIGIVVEETAGRVPVYAGTGGIATGEVVRFTKMVQNRGIAAVSVITPYFVAPDQEELYRHYSIIAGSVDIPVILYNIPMRTGVHLEPETVARLSEIDNIWGIKDSSGKFENIRSYIEQSRKDFCVLAGTDSLIYATLEAGGRGAIAATANVVPELVVSIYNLFAGGKFEEAKKAQEKLKPLREAFALGTAPGVLKEAVNLMGIPAGPPRKPVARLSGEALEKLEKVLQDNYL